MSNEITIYDNKAMVDIAEKYITEDAAGLTLPKNYDYKGAVSALYLQCVSLKTTDGQPVLEACTKDSIRKAIQDMLTKGLNPNKKQCYPIPYAVRDKETKAVLCWELQLQESYFGRKRQAYTNNLDVVRNSIHSQCIYKGDIFEYEIIKGKRVVTKHEQKFENIKDENIIGAYATVAFKDGTTMSDIMTTAEIKKSWAMSRSGGGVHAQFTHEMCCKTVESRLAKKLSNATDDEAITEEPTETQLAEEVIYVDDIEDEIAENNAEQEPVAEPQTKGDTEKKPSDAPEEKKCSKCGKKITEKVFKYSKEVYGKPLCMNCQGNEQ